MIMDRLYGGVCYAGIDTDPELKYPKGAGRVAFSNQQSYIAAISARFVQLQHGDIDKRVSAMRVGGEAGRAGWTVWVDCILMNCVLCCVCSVTHQVSSAGGGEALRAGRPDV